MNASRALARVLVGAGLFGMAFGAPAAALAGTPALVVDADTGKVLYSERATDVWYPASITKLMTTYVALEMVRDGRASMNQLLTMSAEASRQPPSKMGFKPGTQVTLDNALKIIMVKSANDVAMMIGENLGGSVDGFAEMMNDAARRIGMRESVWVNPNGLPDERQHTSARDMVLLARALYRDFPNHADLFRIPGIKFGRKVIPNHNGLLGRYPGTDGMKTGFICSGGFNLVASAHRNGRHLIAVVLGANKAKERDLRAADLFDKGFQEASGWTSSTVDQLAPSNTLSPPDMRSVVCGKNRAPSDDDEPAVVAHQDLGKADKGFNPLSPLTLAFADTNSLPDSPRRTLGPRAPFEPVPVWIGAAPPANVEDPNADDQPIQSRITSRTVKTKSLKGHAARQAANKAVNLKAPPAILAETGSKKVEPVKAAPRRGSETALKANLSAKPVAEQKGKVGAKPVSAKPVPAKQAAAKKTSGKPAAKAKAE